MYSDNYYKTFMQGVNNAEYDIDGRRLNSEKFLKELIHLTKSTQEHKGEIYFFGNGASASFANHMALDWSKNGGVKANSLSDSALLTALSNDYSYEKAFVEFSKINKVSSKDLIVTISSSGNSKNIVKVLNYAQENGIKSITLSGLKENNLSRIHGNFNIYYPFKTYGMVECAHQLYLHLWLDCFMNITEWDRKGTQNMNYKDFKL